MATLTVTDGAWVPHTPTVRSAYQLRLPVGSRKKEANLIFYWGSKTAPANYDNAIREQAGDAVILSAGIQHFFRLPEGTNDMTLSIQELE